MFSPPHDACRRRRDRSRALRAARQGARRGRGRIRHRRQRRCSIWRSRASLFGTIVERLGEAGLTSEENGSWRRVIIEKPFGTDLDSARALNRAHPQACCPRSQIYRIDHFLGKETVQNIMVLRFANGIFEPCGTATISTMCRSRSPRRSASSGARNFYEATGALRDMVPNHVFQLLSLTAMEPPNSFRRRRGAHREGQGARSRACRSTPRRCAATSCAASTAPASSRGQPVKAYREEPKASRRTA